MTVHRKERWCYALAIAILSLTIISAEAKQTRARASAAADPVIAAAGDIACDQAGTPGGSDCQQQATSDLLVGAHLAGVLTLGDQQYEDGALWADLYAAGADIVLSGHDHDYERFGRQTPTGQPDPARGIREFVVGTGGRSHYSFKAPQPNSEVRNQDTFGVLELTLHRSSYDWRFVPVAGKTFTDSGTAGCHSPLRRASRTRLRVSSPRGQRFARGGKLHVRVR